jgi:hypothetical protein
MTPAAKSAVVRDVEESRRHLDAARMSVKKASARSEELSKVDMDLIARSRRHIANVRDHFKPKQDNAPHRSGHFHPIDRKILERHLAQAERHVAVGQEHLIRQRELIAQLERDGHDASEAESCSSNSKNWRACTLLTGTASRASLPSRLDGSAAGAFVPAVKTKWTLSSWLYRLGFRSAAG